MPVRNHPWYFHGLMSVELSQVSLRTPYMDNDLVKTLYRAPASALANNDLRVLFYYKHEVVFDEAFTRDKLTDAAIDKLVKTIDDKLTEIENEGRAKKK